MICASSASSSLPCAADRLQDRGAAFLQLTQVAQPLLERAQLRVVERAGDLLAVARDERHRRAAVEQLDRRLHLALADPELTGDPLKNSHNWPLWCRRMSRLPSGSRNLASTPQGSSFGGRSNSTPFVSNLS